MGGFCRDLLWLADLWLCGGWGGWIESHDEGAYAAFEEAIEVEDHEASYIEALRFRVNLIRSSLASSSPVTRNPQVFAALNSMHSCENSGLVVPQVSFNRIQL